jgi:hypothetical protein
MVPERQRVQFLDNSDGADKHVHVIQHNGERRLVIIPAGSSKKPSAPLSGGAEGASRHFSST